MTPLFCHRLEECRKELVPGEQGAKAWCRESVHAEEDIARVIAILTDAMADAGHPDREIDRVHIALVEALVNAHKHGHEGNWKKPISVRYHVSADGLVVEIEDHGQGFDPRMVPDPRAPENIDRESGRGLLMMQNLLSGVCYNEQGNTICLCKHRLKPASKENDRDAPSQLVAN